MFVTLLLFAACCMVFFKPKKLEKEIRDGCWFVASVSKDVLFKSRDRLGAKRAKPLWTEIMELLGGEYKGVRNELYGGDQ